MMNTSARSSESLPAPPWFQDADRRARQKFEYEHARLPEGMLWSNSVNPILREVGATVARMAAATRRKAINRLHELLGALVEHPHVTARTATIFLRIGDGRLRAVATANLNRTTLEIFESDRGIVPFVSRTGVERFVDDVSEETDDYYADVPETQSELAAPLLLMNGSVIGIVNLESDELEHFSQKSLAIINKLAGEIIIELLVLWELETADAFGLPWHPMTHGWSIQQILSEVCHCITRSLDQDRVRAAIPYVDLESGDVHFYATSGAGYSLLTTPLPSFETSDLFQSLLCPARTVVSYNPAMDLARAKVSIEVEEGWLIRIHSVEEAIKDMLSLSSIIVFVTKSTNDTHMERMSRGVNITEALPEIARLIQGWLATFSKLRPLMAHALLKCKSEAAKRPVCKFESLLRTALQTISAQAGSVFAIRKGSRRLECVETTGVIVRAQKRKADPDVGYDLDRDESNLTTQAAIRGVLRINRVYSRVPGKHCALLESRTAKIREVLPGNHRNNRRFLAVSLVKNDELFGVIRIIRTVRDKPFSICDERVIQALACLGAEIVSNWQMGVAVKNRRKRVLLLCETQDAE